MTDILLLDYNGVLVDDEPLHCRAFLEVLAEEGILLDREDYYAEYLGLDDRACFRKALNDDGRPIIPGDVQHLVARKDERYLAFAGRGVPLVPGAGDFVRSAAARARVAIVSGAARREIALGLAQAGLADVAPVVVSREDVPTSKPDPAGFRLALERLAAGAPGPLRVLVVEDSLPGLAAARALGAGCLMLSTAHRPEALAGADAVWESFTGHGDGELEPLFREVAAPDRFDVAVPRVPRGAVGAAERAALAEGAVVAAREGLSHFRLTGPGRVAAVQGLVTCDVEAAGDGAHLFGALLTPKGMIVAPLWVTRLVDAIVLEAPAVAAPAVAEVLTRSLPPRLCRHETVAATEGLGVYGPRAAEVLGAAVPGVALPEPGRAARLSAGAASIVAAHVAARGLTGFDLLVPTEAAAPLRAALAWHGAVAAGAALLEERRILAGHPRLGAEIDQRTLPQEVRFDELGGVSYTKGCYVGQETVARVHFRGHPNRRLVALALGPAAPAALPAAVVAGGRDLGRLTSAAWCEGAGQYVGLAVVRRDVATGATLSLPCGADAIVHPLPWENA